MVDETTVSLSNDSRLIDDIETTFEDLAILSEHLRDLLNYNMGGNTVHVYRDFKKRFGFLFTITRNHKDIRDDILVIRIKSWRDKQIISNPEIMNGLDLFDQYTTQLFYSKLLKFK